MNKKYFPRTIKFIKVLFILILLFFTWFYFTLPDVDYLENNNPKITALMQLRINQAKEKGKRYSIKQEWVRFQEIPELLKRSIRITEDAAFYKHEGVDWNEIKESRNKTKESRLKTKNLKLIPTLTKTQYLEKIKSLQEHIQIGDIYWPPHE